MKTALKKPWAFWEMKVKYNTILIFKVMSKVVVIFLIDTISHWIWMIEWNVTTWKQIEIKYIFENEITESLDKFDPKDGHLKKKDVSDKRVADKLKAIGDGQVMFKCNCTRKVRSSKWLLKGQFCDYWLIHVKG